jgi:hypothetical protein
VEVEDEVLNLFVVPFAIYGLYVIHVIWKQSRDFITFAGEVPRKRTWIHETTPETQISCALIPNWPHLTSQRTHDSQSGTCRTNVKNS